MITKQEQTAYVKALIESWVAEGMTLEEAKALYNECAGIK